jgi:hypothetical protein
MSLAATWQSAQACACCSNAGQRSVATRALDSGKREDIGHLRFAETATLFLGEADVDTVTGIATPAAGYDLAVTEQHGRYVFALRDALGHTGTLALTLPKTLSMFEVDPRDQPDNGHGPNLYKEWTLTAPAAGSGVFRPGIGRRQMLSLILHGRGNSCTSSVDFAHWTLEMRGPKANYRLFGDLVPAQ